MATLSWPGCQGRWRLSGTLYRTLCSSPGGPAQQEWEPLKRYRLTAVPRGQRHPVTQAGLLLGPPLASWVPRKETRAPCGLLPMRCPLSGAVGVLHALLPPAHPAMSAHPAMLPARETFSGASPLHPYMGERGELWEPTGVSPPASGISRTGSKPCSILYPLTRMGWSPRRVMLNNSHLLLLLLSLSP